MSKLSQFNDKYSSIILWSLRIIIGATFIISGLSKSIDLWGFIYKIEQYLHVWNISVPDSIILFTAAGISFSEFILGLFLATGSYKRLSSWALLLIMAGMLPLSIYIAIANPVDDCGCFGDFWVISNGATCAKNIFLTAGVIYLSIYNKKTSGLFRPALQWIEWTIALAYIIIIGTIGYRVQPLIDFRNYNEGISLNQPTDSDEAGIEFTYIYEKDGIQQSFSDENLPDSTWAFIDRKELRTNAPKSSAQSLVIYDENNEEMTEYAIEHNGEQLLLLIPDIRRIDISKTYLINEMNRYITDKGGSMIGIIESGNENIEFWKDISMADYPIYTAEDTSIKEVARGTISLMYLRDGIIKWKRTLHSINNEILQIETEPFSALYTNGKHLFLLITLTLLLLLSGLYLIDKSQPIVKWVLCRKNKKKDVPLHNENESTK